MKIFKTLLLVASLWGICGGSALAADRFYPGQLWLDTDGRLINAHGGGVMFNVADSLYYWFGEHKAEHTCDALVGVTCYSSPDLYNWDYRGVALAVEPNDTLSPIAKGCILERPKVIYNPKTGKYVMYFHLELRGQGYSAAQRGVAVADHPEGPYTLLKNGRTNAGQWPVNLSREMLDHPVDPEPYEWWTPEWQQLVERGMYTARDFEGGQMARDQTLFVDPDTGKAYHIFASEENLTLHISELTDDFLDYTGRYAVVDLGGQNEAPAIFKHGGKYYMITSGCTGWAPNAARLFSADNILGPWTRHPNPCRGEGAERTFEGQSTYILPVNDGKDFIFMADIWRPDNPIDGRYMWLPIRWDADGLPMLEFQEEWQLSK